MKVNNYLIITVLVLLGGCSGPSGPIDPMFDSTIGGTILHYSTNQSFVLELDVAADGGYLWDYSISDTNVVRIDSTGYRPKSGNWDMEGGVTIETFYFRTLRSGISIVEMAERRPWMRLDPPIDSLRFIVLVN